MRSTVFAVIAAAVTCTAVEARRRICYENYSYKKAVPAYPASKYVTPHGWRLVRRVKRGYTWHPARDHAVGS